jgi:hypothetical protein
MPRLAINTLDRRQQYPRDREASAHAEPDTHARYALVIVRGAQQAGEQVATANAPEDEAARRYERFKAHGKGGPD